jgi:hypothetical protein
LNPIERLLIDVERQLREGRRPDPRAIDRHFLRHAGGLIR